MGFSSSPTKDLSREKSSLLQRNGGGGRNSEIYYTQYVIIVKEKQNWMNLVSYCIQHISQKISYFKLEVVKGMWVFL